MWTSITSFVEKHPIEASAPCRIDSGGTWDIKALALPLQKATPVTVNVALDLRTRVSLLPFKNEWVAISSRGFSTREAYHYQDLPFDSGFGPFFAAVSYFGFHGFEIEIASDSPVKSALGGSSTALVALIQAIAKVARGRGEKGLTRGGVLHLGFHLEDAVSPGKCGIQDQAAAVYGGVNLWQWEYGNGNRPFKRVPLLKRADLPAFSRRLLVAFSGKQHVSARINRGWIQGFLSAETRSAWLEANRLVARLAEAIREKDWSAAAACLREEMALRRAITPGALIPVTDAMIEAAERMGCGARFSGAGGGGALWGFGEPEAIDRLKDAWRRLLSPVRGAKILDCAVDPRGVL